MGPIEAELRELGSVRRGRASDRVLYRRSLAASESAFDMLSCGGWLGYKPGDCITDSYSDLRLPDVLSEAIEAAEALGL